MMKSIQRQAFIWLGAVSLLSSVGLSNAATVNVRIVNVSDWYGQLEPLPAVGGPVGGAAALSTYFQQERSANPTLLLTIGDEVGATTPSISRFNDNNKPTIEAMNLMGFQVNTLGNHNFDQGLSILQTQINLADFQYVSANLQNRDANLTGVKNFEIFNVGGIKIGVVGVTNPDAPRLVPPGSFGTIVPTDPVKATIQARGAALQAGADFVIVIAHLGVTGFVAGEPVGPLIDFAKAINPANNKNPKAEVIIGAHTDVEFSRIINGALVYQSRTRGLRYGRATLTVDSKNKKILSRSVSFVTPLVSAVTPDPALVSLINFYKAQLAIFSNTQIGVSNVAIPRADSCGNSAGRSCESLIGDVAADALRTTYGTDFAITNSGQLRADLTCPASGSPVCPSFVPPPYPITNGSVFSVMPFEDLAVTLTLNGAELKTMLENGVFSMPAANGRFPQVSGLCFTYDIALAPGSRVTGAVHQAPDGSCTGSAVDLTAASSYTLTENDFMAGGGDSYPNFVARIIIQHPYEQVIADYVTANSPLNPTIQGRITCTDSNGVGTAPDCPSPI